MWEFNLDNFGELTKASFVVCRVDEFMTTGATVDVEGRATRTGSVTLYRVEARTVLPA